MNIRQPMRSQLRKTKPRPTTPPTRAREEAVGAAWNFLKAYGKGRSVTGCGLGSAATVAQELQRPLLQLAARRRPRWS